MTSPTSNDPPTAGCVCTLKHGMALVISQSSKSPAKRRNFACFLRPFVSPPAIQMQGSGTRRARLHVPCYFPNGVIQVPPAVYCRLVRPSLPWPCDVVANNWPSGPGLPLTPAITSSKEKCTSAVSECCASMLSPESIHTEVNYGSLQIQYTLPMVDRVWHSS